MISMGRIFRSSLGLQEMCCLLLAFSIKSVLALGMYDLRQQRVQLLSFPWCTFILSSVF
jgi:hypothetical protein